MSRRLASLAAVLWLCALAGFWPAAAAAAPAPAWALTLTPMPGAFAPGATGEYLVSATNVGAAPSTAETAVIEVTLPPGVTPLAVTAANNSDPGTAEPDCEVTAQGLLCETSEAVHPGYALGALFSVEVPAALAGGEIEAHASVSGGGANPLQSSVLTPVQSQPLPFGFLADSSAHLTEEDGSPDLLAGSHPYQATIRFGFPTESIAGELTGAGHPRDVALDLPRGLIANPAASPVLCTEAELISQLNPGCPEASEVGVVDVTTLVGEGGGKGGGTVLTSSLYNMVPPPGAPAEVAFDVAEVGIFVHFLGAVRSDAGYGVEAYTRDLLALTIHPIFGAQTQLWGDPSAPAHKYIRGNCRRVGGTCDVAPQQTAFLTAPGDCPGKAPLFEAFADSWEEPGQERQTQFEGTDLAGNPTPIKDCEALEFEPSFQSRPTTNLTDSPSGLTFKLHLPQSTDLASRAKADLRDAVVSFPAGMTANASQASGLEACTETQIGLLGGGGTSFSRAPQSCPAASKLGTVEVSSPVLVRRNDKHEVEVDPETHEPLPEVLHGAIYLAQPFANPFGTLVATYLVIEDEKTGIIAKLAGEAQLDPQSGQVTVSFRENPELPIEDIAVRLFGGSRGALLTPPTCGPHATDAQFTPWSAPEEPSAQADSFALSAAPGGGPCPAAQAAMPNAPALRAGTLSPAAGKFSPLVFKLSRNDGSQRMAKIDATLPLGLSAKLAGVAECSEAAIAKARSREVPNQGATEKADPSCPAASQVGTITVGAGGGPTPFYTTGHAYLAGPYKGAPLSIIAIAPAVAGPFDLGAVVVRSALYLDPETAQGHIVSDPLPQILDGVPVDVRSVEVNTERPEFTLNPTSCAEKAFNGQVTSTLGQPAPISERFQAGGCSSLPYKPKLSAKLFGPTHRGGHPRLRTVFSARPGDANTARLSFALPHSEFIDQAHFRTICTRVQFAANQCPAGAVYGHVTATSPLLDYALEGPIYLRSSSHKLPDVVAVLKGPPSQPIEVDLDGRVDSVNGGIRTTFETVPDAPVTRAVVILQGGKKGLFENSTDICKGTHRATLKLNAQNGQVSNSRPKLVAQCKKGHKGKGGRRHH